MRKMLIIGSTVEEARAFVGMRPGAAPGDDVDPARPSLLVPESMWPTGEAFSCSFMAAVGWVSPVWTAANGPVDALIVTRAALAAYGATVDDVRAWSGDLLNPDGGWLHVQPEAA